MAGGNNDQMLNMGLMIAAGIAAPELAPVLMEGGALGGAALGATEATALTGAGLSGLTAAATGQDAGKAALMGGLGGAAAGYFGGVQAAEPGSMLAAGPTTPGAGLNTVPTPTSYTSTLPAGGLNPSVPQTPSPMGGNFNPNFSGSTAVQPSAFQAPQANGLFTNAGNISVPPTAVAPSAASAFDKANMIGGGVAGINALLQPPPTLPANTPGTQRYTGPLSKFKYDPSTYQPDIVTPPTPLYKAQYAQGGIASLPTSPNPNMMQSGPSNVDFMGNDMYPQSQIQHSYYATPTQLPTSAQQAMASYEPNTNPLTGQPTQFMAEGGIAQLAVGGKLLKGDGDGMSDGIKANIGGKQEARLADGEFVIPADVVSHLGNGSTDAGAKHLYSMMDKVRKARTGNPKQGKQINADRYMTA
jgi:hypothetical protein